MVKVAKEEGVRVSAEVCPHHFTLSTDDMKEADTNYKMNPPLRTKEDVKALREGLRDGIMEVISTDHAPHTFEDKTVRCRKHRLELSDWKPPHVLHIMNWYSVDI